MLCKSFFETRKLLLTHKYFQIKCNSFHGLSSRPLLYPADAAVSLTHFSHIIHRYESSNSGIKDKILDLPNNTGTVMASSTTQPRSNDSLPDIPIAVDSNQSVVENISSDVPEIIADAVVPLNALGEPTLQSLGIGSYYTPIGWLQNIMEFLHCQFDAPWFIVISSCVFVARLALFPMVIKQQRNSIKMMNAMPEMQAIQEKLQKARTYGNHVDAMKAGMELAAFMKKKDINPVKSVIFPMVQAPVFLSFFWGLRNMANTPVESMSTGGFLWVPDLTVYDAYYILPTVTCATLFLVIKLGAEFPSQMPSGSPFAKYVPYVMKSIPLFVFPFIMHFPSAVSMYWATNNIMTLTQVLFLKIPKVRTYFNIERQLPSKPNPDTPFKKGIVKDFKSSLKNIRIAREIEERERLDEMSFKRAGRAPPTKTFKKNPLIEEAMKN